MEQGNLLQSDKGLTLIEVLVSVTILAIVLLTFLQYFIQANTFTNQNLKKTVGVNVARNALMYIENDSFLEVKQRFINNEVNYLYICIEGYTYSTVSQPPNQCEHVVINNLPYKVTYKAKGDKEQWSKRESNTIPIEVTVEWEINKREFETTLEGKVTSEDIR
ncbi:type IV pilus modification PilV family protein [Mangrovibacillus cuniculi]|uniref:Prepilin-type N-terminal cleavage/methylation domain-containing protein n=1 Tax=Mangrovibacillus cuniculi TaxID=2593652 RepID=A0A7S8CBR7_9BACI|nr:prepilin-type N-terminal cleavage/methylation domain-containing protein [Mangrovibacillus cuniculi]QPC47064.1 prepilin-type N-terminal cleavage/methylation domain-containing protein [Mangrovibacillus cuniculi]